VRYALRGDMSDFGGKYASGHTRLISKIFGETDIHTDSAVGFTDYTQQQRVIQKNEECFRKTREILFGEAAYVRFIYIFVSLSCIIDLQVTAH